MAAANLLASKLKLELDGGMDGDKKIIKRKTYSKFKTDIENGDLYDVAEAILSLQELEPLKIIRQDESELTR